MLRAKVLIREGYYVDPLVGYVKPEYDEVDLISVFWHPIEGPQAAVSQDGDINFFPIDKVEVLSQ